MTKGHKQPEPPAVPLPALRIERAQGRPVHHTQAGRIAIPLTLMLGGDAVEDVALVLTAEQTEEFYREVGDVLFRRSLATEAVS